MNSSLIDVIKRPLLDASGMYGLIKILSILVDRGVQPHLHYIVLTLVLCVFQALTSQGLKQKIALGVSIICFALYKILHPVGIQEFLLFSGFFSCFVFILINFIKSLFDLNYGLTEGDPLSRSSLGFMFFIIFYYSYVVFQPDISDTSFIKGIINFNDASSLWKNFASTNYDDKYQIDPLYLTWNIFIAIISISCFYVHKKQVTISLSWMNPKSLSETARLKIIGFSILAIGLALNLQSAYWLRGLCWDGARILYHMAQTNHFLIDFFPPRHVNYLTQAPAVFMLNYAKLLTPQLLARIVFMSIYIFQFIAIAISLLRARSHSSILFVMAVWILVVFPSGQFTVGVFSETAAVLCLVLVVGHDYKKISEKNNGFVYFTVALLLASFGHPAVLLSLISFLFFLWNKKCPRHLILMTILAIIIVAGRTLIYSEPSTTSFFLEGIWELIRTLREHQTPTHLKLIVALLLTIVLPFTPKKISGAILIAFMLWIVRDSLSLNERAPFIQEYSYFLKNICFLFLPLLILLMLSKRYQQNLSLQRNKIMILLTTITASIYYENFLVNDKTRDAFNYVKASQVPTSRCQAVTTPPELHLKNYLGAYNFAVIFIRNERTVKTLEYDLNAALPDSKPCDFLDKDNLPFFYDYAQVRYATEPMYADLVDGKLPFFDFSEVKE